MIIKKSTSFSLLEIVVAMLILSMVVAGLYGLFVTSHAYIGKAGHRLQALNYARRIAETLKIYVSEDPNTPPGAGTTSGHAFFGNSGDVRGNLHTNMQIIGLRNSYTTPDGITMNCNYRVYENANIAGGNTNIEAVVINVTWTEP